MTAASDEGAPRSVVDAIIANATRKYQDADVFMDGAAWSEAEALRLQAVTARNAEKIASGPDDKAYDLKSPVPRIEAELADALERLKASRITFRMYGIPAHVYDDLVAAHKSKDDEYAWDVDTFPLALIAVSCGMVKGPGVDADHLTLDEVERLEAELDKAQFGSLFAAALQVQQRPAEPFTYAATGPTSSTGLKSTTAVSTVPRIAGS